MPFSLQALPLLAAWRVLVLLLLAVVVGELALANRQLATIGRNTTASADTSTEIAGLGEKLDHLHDDVGEVWDLVDELAGE